MPTPSGLYVNWQPVLFTGILPAVSQFTATEILGIEIVKGGKIISFYGDARRFARGKKTVEFERGLKIMTGNIAQFAAFEEGSLWSVIATLQDMNNGVGSGAITVNLANGILKNNSFSGKNNDFAGGTIELEAYSNANDDDPLTYAIAP